MNLLLINPSNPVVTLSKFGKKIGMTKYRVWKPLSILTLASLVPKHWDVRVEDENINIPDYACMPKPDLVAITAFTSQATRAYQLSSYFRSRNISVVLGGIHASMCTKEALDHVDSVITGEADVVFPTVLEDFRKGDLKPEYDGGIVPEEKIGWGRHDLLVGNYYLGAVQTTRGCPLRCNFCSVTAFNGGLFRYRPISHVVEEVKQVREKAILFVDDNIAGTRKDHSEHAKELFRAMIKAKVDKPWVSQSTINFADDDELIRLAAQSGCTGIFIGFEGITPEGVIEVHKKFNIRGDRDFRASVKRIQKHGISVTGSFIMGLDVDTPGIGERVSQAAQQYGVDIANLLVSTPLPGTDLYKKTAAEGRIFATN